MSTSLTYYVAATLDGYIAHDDGTFDGFVWDDELVADMVASFQTYGTVLMGRKTYDVGLREGKTNPYPMLRQVVFSRTMTSPDAAVEVTDQDPVAFVRALKAEANEPIWLCGGGSMAAQLMAAGLIDHLQVKVNPVLFGGGIPLFADPIPQTDLTLTDTKVYTESGIVLLRYDVQHGS
ncbi:MAG: dihydrofolate reductase family protein [Rhodothermales bacterium]